MRRIIFFFTLLLSFSEAFGQSANGVNWDKYFYSGAFSVGKESADRNNPSAYPDPSAWLEIGRDSTRKGLLLPRIVHLSDIATPAKGLIAYCHDSSAVVCFNGGGWHKIGTGGQGGGSTIIPTFQQITDVGGGTAFTDGTVEATDIVANGTVNAGAINVPFGITTTAQGHVIGTLQVDGYIGIGVTPNSYRLNAAGDINATGYLSCLNINQGVQNTVGTNRCSAFGQENSSTGPRSAVFGRQNFSSNAETFAAGLQNQALGLRNAVFGQQNIINGLMTFGTGWTNYATGDVNFVGGLSNSARSLAEFSIGLYGTDYTARSATAFDSLDRLFSVGNGISSVARSDAFVVLKSGRVGIGTSLPLYKLDVRGSATVGTRYTTGNALVGLNSLTAGTGNVAEEEGGISLGTGNTSRGRSALTLVRGSVAVGNETFAIGGADARPVLNDGITRGSNCGAIGFAAYARANRNLAIGDKVETRSFGEMALGWGNASPSPHDRENWNDSDLLWTLGCSFVPDYIPNDPLAVSGQANAISIWKNGHMAIGKKVGLPVDRGFGIELVKDIRLSGRLSVIIDTNTAVGVTDSSLVFINYGPAATVAMPDPALFKGRIMHFANHGSGDATLSRPIYLDALTPITVVSWIWPNNRYACVSDGLKWYAL